MEHAQALRAAPIPERGFTLPETIVATALLLMVTGAIFSLAHPQTAASLTQPAAIDMLQRARAAAEVLLRDLHAAGAGVDLEGGVHRGPLVRFIAPVMPRRFGPNADAFDTARADAITIVSVADTASQSFLGADLAPGAATMAVGAAAGCPVGTLACGIMQGDEVLVFDEAGQSDVFVVLGVGVGVADIRAHAPGPAAAFRAGAALAVASSRTYYLDAPTRQLRFSDGDQTDVPVADRIAALAFEYFGDPLPPAAPQPPLGIANCLFSATGVPLGGLAVLTPAGGSLAPLPLALFTDGPWCGAGHRRFDADLLRIRRIRVTLRVEAVDGALRGRGAGYASPGTSQSALRTVPDFEVAFDIAPRNFGAAR